MQSFSAYFVLALLCGGALVWAASWDTRQVEAFYGFAETAETEVNFNYPIEVQEILVKPGAEVREGQVLMRVKRAREKERLADQDFRIQELRAEGRLTAGVLQGKLEELEAEYDADRIRIDNRRDELSREATYRKQLLDAFAEGEGQPPAYAPLDDELAGLDRELAALQRTYDRRRAAYQRELELVRAPRDAEAQRLAAERDFDAAQQEVMFDITAPADGVIGSLNAKIAEHKSSFSPLIILYERNPREVKAYIHEDRILQAEVGDSVRVTSITSPETNKDGVIIGLGSRIVEIPARLRRMPDIKTYGREVIIDIPANNPFLQKEKVELTFKEGYGE